MIEGEIIEGKTIVVWFSCGVVSAIAAKITIEKYGATNTVRIVNTGVKEEDEDNLRFLKDIEKWIGKEIEFAQPSKFPSGSAEEVWIKTGWMAGPKGARCTKEIKKEARYEYEERVHIDWNVLGFAADEKGRHDRFIIIERPNVIPVLIDEGITKARCFVLLEDAGIEIPKVYKQGYPNANCIGCVKATSPAYWNLVRRVHPEVWQRRLEVSKKLNVRLARWKGKRVFIDEIPQHFIGKIRGLKYECGIFCDTKKSF